MIQKKKDFLKLLNILQNNNIIDQSESLYQSYIKFKILKLINYKNSNKLNKTILVSHNIFYIKYIP